MKKLTALLAALIITILVGAMMFTIGTNAVFAGPRIVLNNPNTSAVQQTSAQNAGQNSANTQAQVAQLQDLIKQYQQQAQQYQDQINQAQQQLQQYQQLLLALQQRGIIQIGNDGNIYLPQGNFGGDFH